MPGMLLLTLMHVVAYFPPADATALKWARVFFCNIFPTSSFYMILPVHRKPATANLLIPSQAATA